MVKRFAQRANRCLRVGDPNDAKSRVGALISQQRWEKVFRLYPSQGVEEAQPCWRAAQDKPSRPACAP
ncbi:hypothetical protein ACNKHL_26455 [Shigella flexneri]